MGARTEQPRWKCTLLRAASFKLDAGSMFGIIPRVVWSRSFTPDDTGRMPLQHNCLLLERQTPSDDGPNRVLIEVGTGNKLPPKMRDVFVLEDRWVGDALAEHGVACESIDAVVVSHLHFDHAGALTRLPTDQERASGNVWSAKNLPESERARVIDGGGADACVPSFPSARIYVQQREWQDALAGRSVMNKTYYSDHLLPVQHQVELLDSPRPFPIGVIPDSDARPLATLEQRTTEIAPGTGIDTFLVPGHTWGQQATRFTHTSGRTVCFVPDVLPTLAHAGRAYSLAYDVEPYTSMVTKRWLLDEASRRGWVLCLGHEPGNPFCTVIPNDRGWFNLEPADL